MKILLCICNILNIEKDDFLQFSQYEIFNTLPNQYNTYLI